MFDSIISDPLTLYSVSICTLFSLLLGGFIAFAYAFKTDYSRNFVITLSLLPLIVQAIIMMVNGNVGTGVAVVGAFSLIRFRTVPGNSRDITCIFLATAVGIATGIGQVWFALAVTILAGIIYLLLKLFPRKKETEINYYKDLRITIPEDLDYEIEINDILNNFTKYYELIKIKTTNMGSLYTLDYKIKILNNVSSKQLIDELRIKNSNLPIALSKHRNVMDETL